MLPLVARIRDQVDCAVAAQPVPYRTTEASPTMESLRTEGMGRVFPLALDPFSCTRFEMADFAVAARGLGVGYVGICCGRARTTSGPWLRRSAAPCQPASTHRPWTCIRSWAPRPRARTPLCLTARYS
jgi:hypothetical protein